MNIKNYNFKISSKNKDTYYSALFLIFPGILLFSIFVLLPVVETLFISFTNWNGYSKIINYVGFDTYLKVILISAVGGGWRTVKKDCVRFVSI